jgi:hypothetical protein
MKIEIESTPYLINHNGHPARIWIGRTERGACCHVLVALIAVDQDENQDDFQAELEEPTAQKPEAGGPWDARMFLG